MDGASGLRQSRSTTTLAARFAGALMRGIRSDTTMDTVTGMVYNRWGPDEAVLPYNIWFDGDWTNPRVTDERITAGLADYAGMMQAGPPNIQALDWPDASLLFSQGRAAFFIDASLFGPGFEDESASAIAGKTGYAILPPAAAGGDSYTGHWMWGLGIPANAPNPDAGWYFIQWMTSKANEPRIGTFHRAVQPESRPGTMRTTRRPSTPSMWMPSSRPCNRRGQPLSSAKGGKSSPWRSPIRFKRCMVGKIRPR